MAKTIAVLQSNYIPWKGYFELIDRCDEFILYDDVQYTRRNWRNRNKLKTPQGCFWLTLAVEVKGKYHQKINQTRVADSNWAEAHWRKIENAYGKTPYFKRFGPMVEAWYQEAATFQNLSDINRLFITRICHFLQITTKISSSADYQLVDGKSQRLLKLCVDAGAQIYLSGQAAQAYLDVALFEQHNIEVQWMEYHNYPIYGQPYGDFEHGVTILDVIFNCGMESRKFVVREHNES